ncbi:MAG TPA: ATP-binding protein [Candidatus Dormibacteraeota bacterium]|nr:ATP-binding protein [Candidatus Dormibacteraeota bacterium]
MAGPYALLWSGGKDSALALARARAAGLQVSLLLSFHDSETGRVRFHATRVGMLRAQARAIDIELRAVASTWPEMEARLAGELSMLRAEGFGGVLLGDIHLADVRAWYEERVTAAGLEHVEPLWQVPSADLLAEFVASGGRAVVTCVELAKLDRSWLGRIIDQSFVNDIAATGVDACGENGEYHSFAFAGPVFRAPVRWQAGETGGEDGFAQLDLLPL